MAFTGDRAVMGVIERIVAPLGRRIDESSPMVDARLKDGSRVNAIIPPLALKAPPDHTQVRPAAGRRRSGRLRRISAGDGGLSRDLRGRAQEHRVSRAAPARARPRCSTSCPTSSPTANASSRSKTRPNCSCSSAHLVSLEIAPGQCRRQGRGRHPRSGEKHAAHAARPHRRRRVPRRRGARHAAGHEYRS